MKMKNMLVMMGVGASVIGAAALANSAMKQPGVRKAVKRGFDKAADSVSDML